MRDPKRRSRRDKAHTKGIPRLTWDRRFEKSLYDLIRGLRNHKGNEREYIQNSLKECRAEVRGQDMGERDNRLFALVSALAMGSSGLAFMVSLTDASRPKQTSRPPPS